MVQTGWLQPMNSVLVSRLVQGSAKSGINNAGHAWITGFSQSRLDDWLPGCPGGILMCLRCAGMYNNGPGGRCLGYVDHVPRESRATYG